MKKGRELKERSVWIMLKKVFVTGMSIKGEPISQILDALIHPFHDHLYNTPYYVAYILLT